MPLVSGKCPQCGASLKINDQAKGELTCPYCGSLYLVEQALEVTNITNNITNNISAENVVIDGFDELQEIQQARTLLRKAYTIIHNVLYGIKTESLDLVDDYKEMAFKKYTLIHRHNPNNYEAECMKIVLDSDYELLRNMRYSGKFEFGSLGINNNGSIYSDKDKLKAIINLGIYAKNTNDVELQKMIFDCYGPFILEHPWDDESYIDCLFFIWDNDNLLMQDCKKKVRGKLDDGVLLCYSLDEEKVRDVDLYEKIILKIDNSYVPVQKVVKKQNKGCYVATCVYGSYDCSQVWRLRRYRDNYLDKTFLGRLFIKLYYLISPKLVKLFGNKKWFRKPIKIILDKKIKRLEIKGYEDTPYNDKY